MPLFDEPFSVEIPIQIGVLTATFFINQNLYVIDEECCSDPHNHHDYEFRYFVTGKCKYLIEKEPILMEAGDLLIVHPMEYHCQPREKKVAETSQYNVRVAVESADEQALLAFRNAMARLRKVRDTHGRICAFFELLSGEMFEKHIGYINSVRSICVLLLTDIIRMAGSDMLRIFPSEDLRYNGFSRTKIDVFFNRKYPTNVRIQDLAEDMKVSPRQINYIMHRMFGVSFSQKLTEMRLQKSLVKLTYGEEPISKICQECGFKNQNYFAVCFRKAYGITPSQYRKQAKKIVKENPNHET